MKETNQMPVWSKHLSLPNDFHAYHAYKHLNWICTPSPTLIPPRNHQIFIKFNFRLFKFSVLRISLMQVCLMLSLTKLWGHHNDFLSKLTWVLTLIRCVFPLWQHSLWEIWGIFHKGLHLFQQNEGSWKYGKLWRNEI